MANFWTFRNPAKPAGQQLEEYDLGSATLMEFLADNPSLGPVRRGRVKPPEVKFLMGGDSPSTYTPPAMAEEVDPWSPSATTENPTPPTTPVGSPTANLLQPSDPLSVRQSNPEAYTRYSDTAALQGREIKDPRYVGAFKSDPRGRQNPDAFAAYAEQVQFEDDPTGQRYDLGRDYSQETGGYSPSGTVGQRPTQTLFSPEAGQVKQYGEYSPDDLEAQFEVNPDFDVARAGDVYPEAIEDFKAVIQDLPPETQAKAGVFLQGISGPLFDENGNPIFPELPMDLLADLLKDPDLSAYAGSIIETLLDSRSAVIQNATSTRAMVEAAEAQYNPFSRTAAGDRSLQDMLAQREIERTEAQFNPFGLSTAQGVQAIQDQFNPYMQDAAARQALAETQFNPYGQDAADRTALISAQFNPYDFSQAQGLEGISRQFNPYGETAADRLALARMAANPFALSALEHRQMQSDIARGGLSAAERLEEIRAANNPMNTQNLLTFLANPSAVGTAVQLGGQGFLNQLTGGQGIPQAAPSPQQMMTPPPSPAPMTPTPTGSADYSFNVANPMSQPMMTEADLARQTEEEQAMSIGAAAAQGLTPSGFKTEVRGVTPWGIDTNRGLL